MPRPQNEPQHSVVLLSQDRSGRLRLDVSFSPEIEPCDLMVPRDDVVALAHKLMAVAAAAGADVHVQGPARLANAR